MRTVSPSRGAELVQFLLDAHLPQRALEPRQRFVRVEVRHRRQPLDALARDDERAVVVALDPKGVGGASARFAPAAARRSRACGALSIVRADREHRDRARPRRVAALMPRDLGKARAAARSSIRARSGDRVLLSDEQRRLFAVAAGFHARELAFRSSPYRAESRPAASLRRANARSARVRSTWREKLIAQARSFVRAFDQSGNVDHRRTIRRRRRARRRAAVRAS